MPTGTTVIRMQQRCVLSQFCLIAFWEPDNKIGVDYDDEI